jgi:hypothetical protein
MEVTLLCGNAEYCDFRCPHLAAWYVASATIRGLVDSEIIDADLAGAGS